MNYNLGSDMRADIQGVASAVLERIVMGCEAALGDDESFVIKVGPNQYTVGAGWSIRFTRRSGGKRAKSDNPRGLSPNRFVATSPDGTVTLTVENGRVSRRISHGDGVRPLAVRRYSGTSAYAFVGK